jgi:outer membrane lipoprotein carrier protein
MARIVSAALLFAFLLSAGQAALAASATRALDGFFDGLRTLQADFEQTIVRNGQVLQQTRGRLHIQRPGKFRWSYAAPFEQLIVTDGETLWVYEPDLEQATRSRLDDTVGNTPAILLSTLEPLRNLFAIVDAGPKDGLDWVMLEPLGEQTTFSSVFLGFRSGDLAAMEIIDALDHSVRIRFKHLERNVTLDSGLFGFTPPPGVDVISED